MGHFIEYVKIYDNYYGTHRTIIEDITLGDKVIIIE